MPELKTAVSADRVRIKRRSTDREDAGHGTSVKRFELTAMVVRRYWSMHAIASSDAIGRKR